MKYKNYTSFVKRRAFNLFSIFEKKAYSVGVLSLDINRLPNFLCIGAQKAGTTWLYENLKCHPEIFIPDKRDLHYFDYNFYRPLSFYLNNFKDQENKVRGEVMPGYGLLNTDRIGFVYSIIPNLKLIYLLRNPIERAWSHAIMRFTKFQGRSLSDISNTEFIAHFNSELSLKKGNYLKIIENWEKFFPEKSISFFFYDDIIEKPEVLLNEIFRFLGATAITNFEAFKIKNVINAGVKAKIPDECLSHLKVLYKDDIYQMRQRFGMPVERWINKYYE